MKGQIALGFQNTVDFELKWDPAVIEEMIRSFDIRPEEIQEEVSISSHRDMILVLLYYMTQGTGTERSVSSSQVTRSFAQRFSYQVTLGGTAVRAAIAMSQIGIPSTLHACSLNRHFRALIPKEVEWVASVPDEGEDFHPHVIVQYPVGAHISANGIDITTTRANRVIFAHDPPSMLLEITPEFGPLTRDAKVFLAASYNVMRDEKLVMDRMETTISMMKTLSPDAVTLMEDGCFESPQVRQLVTSTLAPHLRLFSMNEDELQDRLGRRIDILDPEAMAQAIGEIYRQIGVPVLVCHSAYWTIAYGQQPHRYERALRGGIAMAATRYRLGDRFDRKDYEQTLAMADQQRGLEFARALTGLLGEEKLLCVPCKDLSTVSHPTTIGLGDAFMGGLLPNLIGI